MRLTDKEISLARYCVQSAIRQGARQARASLSKSISDSYAMLGSELDKVTHSADLSIFMHLFVDGRYFTCSTNRLSEAELDSFIAKAIASGRLLEKDECRCLPEKERLVTDAVTGFETGLYDPEYEGIAPQDRLESAKRGVLTCPALPEGVKLISCECEYGDTLDDNVIIDSIGTQARHTETTFNFSTEVMLEDSEGRKYSGFWWESAATYAGLDIDSCANKALSSAMEKIGAGKKDSFTGTMIVDRCAASRLVGPILSSLYAMSIQQKNSFLCDSLGKKIFSHRLTLRDNARALGKSGARYFDTEGVATEERDIIRDGVVSTYFIDNWSSRKMDLPGTIEGPSRLEINPFPSEGLGLEAILERCGEGILVTGFNGGNCNQTTGDFSFGIEGFEVKDGKKIRPVHEMLITGNMIELWNNVLFIGNDPLGRSRWQIPTLAFSTVSFTA